MTSVEQRRNDLVETPAAPGFLGHTFTDIYWLAASVTLLLLVPIFCAKGRIFWEDEVLGFMLLRDPSLHHMVIAWLRGADGGGLSFYLTGRWWFDLFGSSILSFRMYSEVCFAVAFVFSWLSMRRFYSPAVATWASLSVWLVSPVLIQHMFEGRFYGLFMAAVALTIYLCVRANEHIRLSAWLYPAIFLAHSLLITSHLLGVAYSGCIILAMVLLDRAHRRFRPALYIAALASWLWLIPSLPAVRASARVGKPFFWTKQPDLMMFVTNYTGFTKKLGVLIALAIVSIAVVLARRGALAATVRNAYAKRRPIYVVSLLLFTLPVVFYLEGMVGPALCISRYLQPIALATVCLIAELITLGLPLLPGKFRSRGLILGAWFLFGCFLGYHDFVYQPKHTGLETDYTAELVRHLPHGVPVVCEDAFAFTELISRQHASPVAFTYLLDWQNSLAPQTPRLEVTQFHLMENWRELGYFSGSIQYVGPFLKQNPVFYTITMEDVPGDGPAGGVDRSEIIGSQLHRRLATDPAFQVKLVDVVPLGELKADVWRVCQVESGRCGG